MESSTRWTLIAIVTGLCTAYAIWGVRTPVPAAPTVVTPESAPLAPKKKDPAHPLNVKNELPTKAQEPDVKSALKVTPENIEFGEIKVTEQKTATVLVENTGAAPITIEELKGSCGCLKIEMLEKTIEPGKSQPINLSFTGQSGRRPETYQITLTTSEAGKPKVKIPVHGKVIQIFLVEPPTLYFEAVPKGQSKTLESTITRVDGKAFELKDITAGQKEFSFKWSAVTGSNNSAYKIQATATGIKAGAFTEGAAVVTDHPVIPVMPLHLSARVTGDVTSNTPVLTSATLADGTVEIFETTITRHSPGPLVIQGVQESGQLPLHFTLTRVDDSSCKLNIKISGAFPNQAPLGEFVIRTNVEEEPLHIPYRVLRKGAVHMTDPKMRVPKPKP